MTKKEYVTREEFEHITREHEVHGKHKHNHIEDYVIVLVLGIGFSCFMFGLLTTIDYQALGRLEKAAGLSLVCAENETIQELWVRVTPETLLCANFCFNETDNSTCGKCVVTHMMSIESRASDLNRSADERVFSNNITYEFYNKTIGTTNRCLRYEIRDAP